MKFTFDWKEYAAIARQMAAEGCVLLRNEDRVLPMQKGERVSIFGRIQTHYYKSGTGSGGMVNTPYVVSIPDGLRGSGLVEVNEELAALYTEWEKSHPFDQGVGWASEPWSQEEMELEPAVVQKAAEKSDIALVIIGRSAGEDKDAVAGEGSYYLTAGERQMLQAVTAAFSKVTVVLNVGSVMDMQWVEEYQPQAVLYVWQGGMEGGNAVADVLTGRVNPSGKLADTIAYHIEDYPSAKDFGDEVRNFYTEDVYVGYRYFETAAREAVQYPFGFGLSYTDFDIEAVDLVKEGRLMSVRARVTNVGDTAGKEVVQVYYAPPQGKLAKPIRNLIRYEKTHTLEPGESQTVTLTFPVTEMASYDDSGVTGHRSCWVLEKGNYQIYVGNCVRGKEVAAGKEGKEKPAAGISMLAGTYVQDETRAVLQLEEACAPVLPYKRMRIELEQEKAVIHWEDTPLRTIDLTERIAQNRPADTACTGDKGILLRDVDTGKNTMEQFLAQLTDEDLIHMSRGEGMCSPKVTPGIASAFGGVTDRLQAFGIPAAGCSDGPSGIRMDCGTKAFSCPNGTLMACAFNLALTAKLYDMVGRELRKNKIDSLLGPGVNIHRNPLNGRNFEYFSEDPYVTGSQAATQLKAMRPYKVTGTIKHYACNNQETKRRSADAVVSERALREIYLKAFEICVREGGAYSVMSTYGPLNGVWTAGHYDLLTTVLRKEWGFKGIVMTDWWADINEEGGSASIQNTVPMIRAQNDLYMVTADAKANSNHDNSEEGLAQGKITRGELLRNAANICRVILRSAVMDRVCGEEDEITELNRPKEEEGIRYEQPSAELKDEVELDVTALHTEKDSNNVYAVRIPEKGTYRVELEIKSDQSEVAQATVTFSMNGTIQSSFTVPGTKGEWVTKTAEFTTFVAIDNYLAFYFAQSGLQIRRIHLSRV